jgi:hypothetical protein
MNKIIIGSSEKELSDASESWITQQVRERQHAGQIFCVRVILKTGCVDMILATLGCGSGGGGGGRSPNHKEQEIFALWNERHLNQSNWALRNLIAFLKQLKNLF